MDLHRAAAGCALLLLGAAPAVAADPGAGSEIVRMERAFADAFARDSWRSFVDFAADDAVFYNDGAFLPARPFYRDFAAQNADRPRLALDWWPSFVEVACAGDLAWSTGPTIRGAGEGRRYSHYVTVWQRQSDGGWRWVFDRGNPHLEPGSHMRSQPPAMAVHPDCAGAAGDSTAAEMSLRAADRALMEGRRRYRAMAGNDLRLHRFGRLPVVGARPAAAAIAVDPPLTLIAVLAARAARGGDLGYSYGRVSWPDAQGQPATGMYLHVWRRAGNRWRLVLDQLTPDNPPPLRPAG